MNRHTCIITPGKSSISFWTGSPLLPEVDQVLVMTVNPGFGGQELIRATLPKLQQIRSWIDAESRPFDLVVDGGVGPDTVEEVAIHGANVFVMGSAFFKSSDYKLFVDRIHTILAPYATPDAEG